MKNFVNKIFKFSAKYKLDILFLAFSLGLGIYFQWNVLDAAVFIVFIWIILNPLPSKYFAASALLLLVLTPIFLIAEKKDIAEQIAIHAYYFLIFTVMMAVCELKKDDNSIAKTND